LVKGAISDPPGQYRYVVATIAGGPQTVDPALAYDTASGELIANVYDPLIFFKMSGSEVVPWLADSYTVSPDGQTYTFHIRAGAQWQDPAYGLVTPADVEYSFERMLVRDYTGGPAWMFWFPIFNKFGADLSDPVAQGTAIDNAITSNATHATVQFQTGRAYLPFLGILAQTWGSIVCKQWAIDHGDWNPAVDRLSDGTWVNVHDPQGWPQSPLDNPYAMMGSGPFEFNYLNPAVSWSILRNPQFWGGWGTNRLNNLGFTGVVSRGYVDEIVEYFISGFATRLAGFTGVSPIYDNIAVPRASIGTVWQQPGVKCIYPLASQAVNAMFFAYDVGLTSTFIGTPTGYGYFGELGIAPDFFSDIHVRKAVAYSFNWTSFIAGAYLGEAQQVGIPLPAAGYEPYYNSSSALKYSANLTRAVQEWKQAWGGTLESPGPVWTNGLYFKIPYNEGSTAGRNTAAKILEANIEAVNPKFHIDVVGVPWNGYGLVWHGGPGGYATGPIFVVGWLVDYPDPDDWTVPFMSPSGGIFAYPQHLDLDPYAATFENLITWGANNATIEGRNYNYQKLWQLYHQQVPSVPTENAFGRRFTRDWVHGFYYNPIFSGVYGYPLWKEELPWEDINEDGKVDIKDLATGAKAFGAYFIQTLLPPYPVGPAGTFSDNWNSKADVNIVDTLTGARSDMKIDIKDLAQIAKQYGYIAPPWTPPP
jgi:peptide/nickel transport system substrate-binding protein